MGALLAVVLPLPRLARTLRTAWRRIVSLVGIVALVGLVVATRVADYETVVANRWFLPATAVVSAAALVFAATPSADRTLGWVVPAWLGRRSYGLYLVHWPIVVWLDAPGVIQFGLALVLAEASYRVVEAPIRFRRLLPTDGRAALAGVVAVVVVGALAVAPGTIVDGDDAAASAAPGSVVTVPPQATAGRTASATPEIPTDGSVAPVSVTEPPRDPGRPLTVWMVGDSVFDGILDWVTGRRDPTKDVYDIGSGLNAAYPFDAGERQYLIVDLAIPACEGSEDVVKIRLGEEVVDESEPCRGWRERWTSALRDWGPPDVVLWQLGGATTWVPRSWTDDPSVLTLPADPAWDRHWRHSVWERLGWLFDSLPPGTPVLWSTPALPNRGEYKRGATPDDAQWTRITTGTELTVGRQREIAAGVPGLTLVDFNAWTATSGPDGGPLPGTLDGVHWNRTTTFEQVVPWFLAQIDAAAG